MGSFRLRASKPKLGATQRRLGASKPKLGAMVPKLVIVVAVLALMTALVSPATGAAPAGAPATAHAKPIPAPAGLPAFYSVPQPIPTKIGKLIKSQKIASTGVDGTVYRVMYVSETQLGKPVAVTGLVIVPNTPAPAGGYPVVTWGHGTNGMADSCTPSLDPANDVPLENTLLDQGWEVTSSDYQGEGTPGLLPYLAGLSAARNTIDIVRAARQMPAANASDNYVVWGHSEGGQTAMFALAIGTTYAPELKLDGVVAGAPPSQFAFIYSFLKTSPYRYYLLMAAGGLNVAYGNKVAPLSQVLTPAGLKLIPDLGKGCSGYLSQVLGNLDITKLTKGDPFKIPAWKKVLSANDPESIAKASTVPLLMIQGADDEQIPVASTQLLATHMCGLGQDLERWIYPGQSHAGVIAPSSPDMVHWIADRFAGGANPDPYAPVGLPGIQTTTCPS